MFKNKKIYISQAWISNKIGDTYRLEISEDILETGNANSNITEAYYTVVKEDDTLKLNINDYIGKQEINKTATKDNIEITVISKQIYQTYEKYKIKIKNNTENQIALDGFRNNKSIYLLDNNGGKKIALKSELTLQELLVNRNLSITKDIKFDRVYNTDIIIKSIVFEDIILNYKDFKKADKENYKDILEIDVNL